MRASILVATPHPAFGDLLRSSLHDSRQYQVKLARTGKEVRDAIQEDDFTLAILDSSLADEPFVPLCHDLTEQQEDIQLVVIPPDNNPNHPSLNGLMPHGYLHRPFYLPDLLETVARLLEQREETQSLPVAPRADLPHWLEDPAVVRSYLEYEIRSTLVQAAIVGASGSEQGAEALRAYAGHMDETAAQEFAAVVFRYWNRGEKTDLMRFVRLSASKRDYLVYATPITGDLVLILAYENSVPLSQIRPQTKALATSLALVPPKDESAGVKRKPAEPEQAPQPAPAEEVVDDAPFFGRIESRFSQGGQEPAGQVQVAESELEGVEFINLSALLGVVPSPDPETPTVETRFNNSGWMIGIDSPLSTAGQGVRENGSKHSDLPTAIELPAPLGEAAPDENPPASEAQPPQPQEDGHMAETRRIEQVPEDTARTDTASTAGVQFGWQGTEVPTQPRPNPADIDRSVEDTRPIPSAVEDHAEPPAAPGMFDVRVPGKTAPFTPPSEMEIAPEEEDGAIEQTRPSLLTTYTNLNQLEPVSPGVSVLNYTCVLVPRLPQHYLTGSLADLLAGWVQQLCLAFGWRLEGLSIRPEYLQWTVQVAPSVSPGNLVKIMRQRTSMHIFNSFAHIREQNPSGDFWAVGYLIVSGTQPPSPQLLRDYILQTRKRQGISR